MKQEEREALKFWEEYREDIIQSTPVDTTMSRADIEKHRLSLEANIILWIKFFFPKYCKFEFARFQIKAIYRLVRNGEWYEVLSWARSLAKSTIVMFVVLYLVLTGKKKSVILASATQDSAIKLLKPYKINLESNGRLKQYYGNQTGTTWKEDCFITKKGASFIGVGEGNAPRGSRNEEVRPDVLLIDDFDSDSSVRNLEIVKKMWQWWEEALYGTRDPQQETLIVFCGNIIAKDCCITRAGAMADHWDIVNIRDEEGRSSWPEKNTEEMLDKTLRKISTRAVQKEYYNNPVTEGDVFKNLPYGKIPSLKSFKFLVIYGDPSPGESRAKKASYKSVWLLGKKNDILYVIKGYLEHVVQSEFIEWYIKLQEFVGNKVPIYLYMENNKLQDPFFQKVYRPMINKIKKKRGIKLNIQGDTKPKGDKASRIDTELEPLDSNGQLIFNEDEKENPHMVRLHDQFQLFNLSLTYPADGPDSIEGGNRIIDYKAKEAEPARTTPRKSLRSRNKNRL